MSLKGQLDDSTCDLVITALILTVVSVFYYHSDLMVFTTMTDQCSYAQWFEDTILCVLNSHLHIFMDGNFSSGAIIMSKFSYVSI